MPLVHRPAQASTPFPQPAGNRGVKLRLWRIVRAVLIAYLLIALMLTLLQRSLIYFPAREAAIRPADAGLPSGRVRQVTVVAGDGVELNGWHVRAGTRMAAHYGTRTADGTTPGRGIQPARPLVLYFPGNAGNRKHRAEELLELAALGSDVILVDYRGYGDNAGSPSAEVLAADARAVWDYATRKERVPPDKIVLFGESLGGGVATRLCAELCDEGTPPGGLVLRSTFSSLADTAAWHYPWLPVRLLLRESFESAELARAVTCPVVQVHGARDRIVPLNLGRKLFAAAPERSASGIEKRFVELRGVGHNDLTVRQFRDAVRELLDALRSPQGEPQTNVKGSDQSSTSGTGSGLQNSVFPAHGLEHGQVLRPEKLNSEDLTPANGKTSDDYESV